VVNRILCSTVVCAAALLSGIGVLYLIHSGSSGVAPRVGDALPLLQLAGLDPQPLLLMVVAWVPAGLFAGAWLSGWPRAWRAAGGAVVALSALALASQASYALAHNLRFWDVVFAHVPGLGVVVEALMFAVGCAAWPAELWHTGKYRA
jgi:hypothetical protein